MISTSLQFFLIFLATIVVTRIFLYVRPVASPTISGFRLHHWMYGIVLGTIGFMSSSIWIFAIGIGLLVDELPYLLMKGKIHKDNYSARSLAGVLICSILVFIFKDSFISFFARDIQYPYLFGIITFILIPTVLMWILYYPFLKKYASFFIIVALFALVWGVVFDLLGVVTFSVWHYNNTIGPWFLHLPLEEWLTLLFCPQEIAVLLLITRKKLYG